MRRIVLSLLLLLGIGAAPAAAQCTGIFGANTFCGSVTGGLPAAVPFSALSSNVIIGTSTITGGVSGRILYDNGGVFGNLPVTGTAGNVVLSVGPTITSSFTATGLVTNADLVNQGTTVNGVSCVLGASCSVTATAASVTVGTTTVISGTNTNVLTDNSGVVGNISPTITINSTSCTLGSTCTISTSSASMTVGTTTVSSGTAYGLLYNNGTLGNTAAGTSSTVLQGAAAGPPTWVSALPSTVQGNITGLGTVTSGTLSTGTTIALGSVTLTGSVGVAHGGTGLTTLTSNAIYKGNGTSAIAASSIIDNGTVIAVSEPVDLTSNGALTEVANAGSTGTTLNSLAKLTGAPSAAVITATTDTTHIIGVVMGGAGTTGNAQIAVSGQAACNFDGGTTAGDYVQNSAGTAGDCTDVGSTYPASGQVIGRVLSTIVSAGTANIVIFGPEIEGGSGSGGGSGTVTSVAIIGGTGTALTGSCTGTVTILCTINTPWNYSGSNVYINTGLVGIGMNSPVYPLDVATTGEWAAHFNPSGGNGGIIVDNTGHNTVAEFASSGTPEWYLLNYASGNSLALLNAASTQIVTVTQSGNIGIGNTSPAYPVDITGAIHASADGIFGGPDPWADVLAYGAKCDSLTDDHLAFQNAINALYATGAAGGIVFVPPGTCIIKATVTLKGGVILQGAGRGSTEIGGPGSDTTVLTVDNTCAYCGFNNIQVVGDFNAAATNPAVKIPDAAISSPVFIHDCNIFGGNYGLYMSGTDGTIQDCYIVGYTGIVYSTGGNWWIRVKLDEGELGSSYPTTYGFFQGNSPTGANTAENRFIQSDLSCAPCTYSMYIADSTLGAYTVFQGGTIGPPIYVNNSTWIEFDSTILSGGTGWVALNSGTGGYVTIANSRSGSPVTVSGGSTNYVFCANVGITSHGC